MRYKPCSDAQKYELKLIGKIKSHFGICATSHVAMPKNTN